jgi:SAM-dependent methyltransferase
MKTTMGQAGPLSRHFRQLTSYHTDPLYPGEYELIAKIIERFDELSLSELVKFVDEDREKLTMPWELRRIWRLAKLSEEEKQKHYDTYATQNLEAGRRDVELLRAVIDRVRLRRNGKTVQLLDLGTGRGAFLATAQKEPAFAGWRFEGTDMDMASLLINVKLNEEQGNSNYRLTCAFGEGLPYEDEAFDIIASFQTLEHIGNRDRQVAFVSEACRCLAPGGMGVFTFPNRFDVLRPEPHVYIRFLGFVPHSMKDRVSMTLRGVPSSDIYPPDPITLMGGLNELKGATFKLLSNSEFSPRPWKRGLAATGPFKLFGPWSVLIARKNP